MDDVSVGKICKRCGFIFFRKRDEENKCIRCNGDIILMDVTVEDSYKLKNPYDHSEELIKMLSDKYTYESDEYYRALYESLEETQWEQRLREKYLADNTEYDEELGRAREEFLYDIWLDGEKEITAMRLSHKRAREEERHTKKCPKCGGTQFTPVRRKFSLLTGFATNKIDLICNSCGAKVK